MLFVIGLSVWGKVESLINIGLKIVLKCYGDLCLLGFIFFVFILF